MRTLMLMRHAKSDWSSGALADFDRPLNDRGLRTAPAMAAAIAALPHPPRLILSSTARRAHDTAEAVAEALPHAELVLREELYGATAAEIRAVIAEQEDATHSLLLVGHNPGMSGLAAQLAGDAMLDLATADVALFAVDAGWAELSPGVSTLTALIRARDVAGQAD